jgi:putative transposase
LKVAISDLKELSSQLQLIHHSDREIQYYCSEYVNLLQKNNIAISMIQSGTPLDNAITERINKTIKNKYLHCYEISNIKDAKQLLEEVIDLYNTERKPSSNKNA